MSRNQATTSLLPVDNRPSSDPEVEERRLIGWRISNGFMTIFFCVACFLQHNDPDPYIWMPAYGIAGLLSGAICFRPKLRDHIVWKVTSTLHFLFSIAILIYVVIEISCVISYPYESIFEFEPAMELLGVFVMVIWLKINQLCMHTDPVQRSITAPMTLKDRIQLTQRYNHNLLRMLVTTSIGCAAVLCFFIKMAESDKFSLSCMRLSAQVRTII